MAKPEKGWPSTRWFGTRTEKITPKEDFLKNRARYLPPTVVIMECSAPFDQEGIGSHESVRSKTLATEARPLCRGYGSGHSPIRAGLDAQSRSGCLADRAS